MHSFELLLGGFLAPRLPRMIMSPDELRSRKDDKDRNELCLGTTVPRTRKICPHVLMSNAPTPGADEKFCTSICNATCCVEDMLLLSCNQH